MISFFTEDTKFNLKDKRKLKSWINTICQDYGKKAGDINYILCSDEYILEINKSYLNHDYYTDIITFDQSDTENTIEGEIYISVDTVASNADDLKINFDVELRRVIIHGVLHLIGFGDKTPGDSKKMRETENISLTKY